MVESPLQGLNLYDKWILGIYNSGDMSIANGGIMNECDFCGRYIDNDKSQCKRCKNSLEDFSTYLDPVVGDGSDAAHWFMSGKRGKSDRDFVALHEAADIEGLFNVEGGYAAVMSQQFNTCDMCHFTGYVSSTCDECGRGPDHMATSLAGWGDGTYPVFSISDVWDEGASVAFAVYSSWISDPAFYEKWRASFASQLLAAVPLPLGTIQITDEVRFSDATSGSTIVVPMNSGDGLVVAWIGEVPELMSFISGEGIQNETLRPIAMGVYTGEHKERIEALCGEMSGNKRRELVSDFWGWPTQTHASHNSRRTPLEMETFTAQELSERVNGDLDHPRYSNLVGHQILMDYFAFLNERNLQDTVLKREGGDNTLAMVLWHYGYLDEAREVLNELIEDGDDKAYLNLLAWSFGVSDATPLLAPIPATIQLSIDQHKEADRLRGAGAILNARRAMERGDSQEASELLQQAMALGIDEAKELLKHVEGSQATINAGWIKHKGGDHDGAVAIFTQALDHSPAEAAYSLGLIADTNGKSAEAESWWVRSAEAGHPEACDSLARHFFALEDEEQGGSWAARGAELGNAACMFMWGSSLWSQGKKEEATKFLISAAEAGEVEAMDFYGQLLNSQGRGQEAEGFLFRAAREAEDPFSIANASNTLAFSYLIPKGRLDEAEELLRRAIDVQAGGPSVSALSNLGTVLFERGNDEAALECFHEVLLAEVGPFDEANEYIARIAARNESPSIAQPHVTQVFFDDPADSDLVAGLEFYDRRDWSSAEPYLRRAAERGNITAIFKLANVRRDLGDEEEAMVLWQLAIDQGNPEAANNLGLCLVSQGRVDEAIKLYRRSAAAGNIVAMFNLGVKLLESGEPEEAEAWMVDAIAGGSGRAAAVWGNRLLKFGRREEGISVLEQGVKLENLSACLMLAVDAQEMRNFDAMVSWASKALEFTDDPNEQHQIGRAWGLLGIGLFQSGQPEEAIVALQTALSLGEKSVIPFLNEIQAKGDETVSVPLQVRFCTMCGAQREELARFCTACGASLSESN